MGTEGPFVTLMKWGSRSIVGHQDRVRQLDLSSAQCLMTRETRRARVDALLDASLVLAAVCTLILSALAFISGGRAARPSPSSGNAPVTLEAEARSEEHTSELQSRENLVC